MKHRALLLLLSVAVLGAPTARAEGGQTEPLTIECPPTFKAECGDSICPADAGEPIVTGGCSPVVTYRDQVFPARCPGERFERTVVRTWTASDTCGNKVSCRQSIHVLKKRLLLDIKPKKCPNKVKRCGDGDLVVAILGTQGFDVRDIDAKSIEMWTPGCRGGPIKPYKAKWDDVSRPYTGNDPCGCTKEGGDCRKDLVLKFREHKVEDIIDWDPPSGKVRLVVTGRFKCGGCSFIASDCVVPD